AHDPRRRAATRPGARQPALERGQVQRGRRGRRGGGGEERRRRGADRRRRPRHRYPGRRAGARVLALLSRACCERARRSRHGPRPRDHARARRPTRRNDRPREPRGRGDDGHRPPAGGMKRLTLVCAAVLLLGGGSAQAFRLPGAPACPIFPADNPWNERVDNLPVAASSAQMIASIGVDTGLHPDFGSGLYDGQPIGIPFDVVSKSTPRSHVRFDYSDESDHVAYPIPKTVHIEGGRASTGDRHAILVDKSACRLYELFALYPTSGGGWKAGSGATWDLRSNHVRPAGWTSADAAGLPILPGLARYDEVARGAIDHALRFTA